MTVRITPPAVEDLEPRRLLAAGQLDPTFGGDGRVTSDFPFFVDANDVGRSVAVQQSDGKVIVAGDSGAFDQHGIGLARYNPDGSLDSTFGAGGRVRTMFLPSSYPFLVNDVVLQLDGKIVVATSHFTHGSATRRDFSLTRYNADGSLDLTFDGDGSLTTDFGGASDGVANVTVQADGKIIAAGYSYDGNEPTPWSWSGPIYEIPGSTPPPDFALARYHPDGTLDTNFGGDGRVTTDIGGYDVINSVAVQPDGKIVAAGSQLARYNPDGTLDVTFASDGTAILPFHLSEVAIQVDGRIVGAGGYNAEFALARYNADGTPDATFDGDGKVTTDFGFHWDYAKSVAVQADGKIVAAGFSTDGYGRHFALARYNPNGALDLGFGGDGKVITSFDDSAYEWGEAGSLVLPADGKIVAAGYSNQGTGAIDFALARYNADGTLDVSFDGDGKVTTDFTPVILPGVWDAVADMAIQPDGKIIAAGSTSSGLFGDGIRLARYNPDGSMDSTFGAGGSVWQHVVGPQSWWDFWGGYSSFGLDDVALQADGRLVVTGSIYTYWIDTLPGDGGGAYYMNQALVVRFNADGSIDASFGDNGRVPLIDYASGGAVAVQADGKIVVSGYLDGGGAFLTRYDPKGTRDSSFGGDGWVSAEFRSSAVALQNDGKIVTAGAGLSRYNPDGSLDTTFDGDGKLPTSFTVTDMAIQADGTIVVAGYNYHPATGVALTLARYNGDGSCDLSFGGDGEVRTALAGGMAVQPDGKIVIVGGSDQDFAVGRFNRDGSPDVTFGWDGRATIDFGGADYGTSAAAIDDSGTILVAGWTQRDGHGDFAIARLDGTSTPQELADLLTRRIDRLAADGSPTAAQGHFLKNKLKHVIEMIDAGQWDAAVARLDSFIKHVDAWDGTIVTFEEARMLIDLAELILEADARIANQIR